MSQSPIGTPVAVAIGQSGIVFPVEVWSLIFNWLNKLPTYYCRNYTVALQNPFNQARSYCNRPEVLAAVSQACRTFYDIALPIRFRRVEVIFSDNNKTLRNRPFERLLGSPQLQDKVINLSISELCGPGHGNAEIIQKFLAGMNNVQSIVFGIWRQTTPSYIPYIHSLTHLKRLEFQLSWLVLAPEAEINAAVAQSTMETPHRMEIVVRDMRILPPAYGPALEHFGSTTVPPWVSSIIFASRTSCIHLEGRLIKITPPVIDQSGNHIGPSLLHITSFQTHAPKTSDQLQNLQNLFHLAPSITSLVLDEVNIERPASFVLSETNNPFKSLPFIPGLRSYKGPSRLAEAIVPGRPVDCVTLTRQTSEPSQTRNVFEGILLQILPILKRLGLSAEPVPTFGDRILQIFPLTGALDGVRTFNVVCETNLATYFEAVSRRLRNLEELGMVASRTSMWEMWLINEFSTFINRQPQLQRFTLVCGARCPDEEFEARFMDRLPPPPAALTFIRLSACRHYAKRGLACDCSEGAWSRQADGRFIFLNRPYISRWMHVKAYIDEYMSMEPRAAWAAVGILIIVLSLLGVWLG